MGKCIVKTAESKFRRKRNSVPDADLNKQNGKCAAIPAKIQNSGRVVWDFPWRARYSQFLPWI